MTNKVLWYVWDMIDISENMHRMDNFIVKVRNGLPALLHALVFAALTLVAFAAAWYFDFQSTLKGMGSITDLIIPELPKQAAQLTWYIILAFTVMPTLLEIFTAGLAKEDIKIIQLAIIIFTLFDAVTDIPRAYALAIQMWPQIQLMGWGLAHLTFWAYFLGILFFATIGFEILLCMFGYCVVSFAWKIFHGEGSYNIRSRSRSRSARSHSGRAASDDVVIIEG